MREKSSTGCTQHCVVKASTYEVTSMPDRKLSARYANMPVRRCFPHPHLLSCTARIGMYSYRVTDESLADFLAATWEVSTEADRIGYRLKGPTFHFKPCEQPFGARADPSNAVDLGYPMGSIQIPGGLEAILLLNDVITISEYTTSTLPSEVILTVLRKHCLEVRCASARVILKRRCTHARPARRTLTKYASRYGCSISPVSWVSSRTLDL